AIALRVLANFSSVVPLPSDTPNMPATWPIATWMPTPVRKPMSTLRDRKLAMNPSRRTRARSRTTPHISAARPASAVYSRVPATATAARVVSGGPRNSAGRDEAGREDRSRRGIRPDDEVSRRPEDGEHEDRQEERVDAGDDGHPGDLGVAHDLWDRQRCEGRAGDHVDRHTGRIDRQDALEDR